MKTIEEFYAHVLQMEQDIYNGFIELADTMEIHNRGSVAQIFRELAEFAHTNYIEAGKASIDMDIPDLKPWEFKWKRELNPSKTGKTHYMMTAYHAYKIAVSTEKKAISFFRKVITNTKNEEIKKLAEEFIASGKEQIAAIESLQERCPEPDEDWDLDMDQPAAPA